MTQTGFDDLVHRLRSMADVARADPNRIDVGGLLGATLDVAADALDRRRSYARKDGSVVEGPDPDHGFAVRALKLAAELRGAINPEDKPPMTVDEFRAEIKARGLKIVHDDGSEGDPFGAPKHAEVQGVTGDG